ncbi:MAG: acyl-CoA thioesterase, partial [Solirubrobacteraceae bacterium]
TRHTNTAYLTMVALGPEGRPAQVPPPLAVTPAQQRRLREAEMRRSNRLAEREQMLAHRARGAI